MIGSATARVPVLSVPVQVDGGVTRFVEMYEGDSVRNAAAAFINANGLAGDVLVPLIANLETRVKALNAQRARDAEAQRVAAAQQAAAEASREITLDVSITVPLKYTEQQDFRAVAALFCDTHGLSRNEYVPVLIKTMQDKAAAMNAQAPVRRAPPAPRPPIFEMDVKVDQKLEPLKFYRGDSVEGVAAAFCKQHNIPRGDHQVTLINAIKAGLVQRGFTLKK